MGTLTTQPPAWIHTAPFRASAAREIAATPDEVFAALADHESWPEWFTSIERVERFGDIPTGIGSNRRVHINRRISVDEEFNVWEPGKEWGFTILSVTIGGLKSMNELVSIQEIGPDRVRVTYTMGIAPKAYLAPVLRLAKGAVVKNLANALDKLGPHIEARRSLPPTPAVAEPGYGTVDQAYATRLATTDPDDGPIWMVNLMQYREWADYGGGDSEGRTGREADDAYAPTGPLQAVGARIVYLAEVEMQLLGEGKPWDRVAIVRYPTRRAFMEMQERPDFQEKHRHKEAGVERTFVIGCHPMVPQPDEGDLDLESTDWADVAHPPSPEDGVCHALHVIKWNESGASTMEGYHGAAFAVAAKHGVRVAGWLEAEGTIVGDGRTWDEVRFNEFPSLAEFMEVVNDPVRLKAQAEHREQAMADTYTLVCRPIIDELLASFTA